jgi:hypothetical protein
MVAAGGCGQQNGIAIYDSLLDSEPPRHTIYAVAQICPEKKDELKLSIMKVQKLKDGLSCSLFAIANATALAFSLNKPEYVYDTTTMRSHLVSCCRKRKIEPFPYVQFQKCLHIMQVFIINIPCIVLVNCPSVRMTWGSQSGSEQLLNARDVDSGFTFFADKFL